MCVFIGLGVDLLRIEHQSPALELVVTVRHCLQPYRLVVSDGHLVFSSRNALAASTPRSPVRPLAGSHVLLDASPAPFSRSRSADVSGPTIWETFAVAITVIAMSTHNVRGERSLVAEDARANVTLVGLLLRRRLFVQRIKV